VQLQAVKLFFCFFTAMLFIAAARVKVIDMMKDKAFNETFPEAKRKNRVCV